MVTRENITIPSDRWINLNLLIDVPVGESIVIFNTGNNDIRLAVSALEPLLDSNAYLYIMPRDIPYVASGEDCCPIWAHSPNVNGLLNVSNANPLHPTVGTTPKKLGDSRGADFTLDVVIELKDVLKGVLNQLRLLNVRVEEAFETSIDIGDIQDEN